MVERIQLPRQRTEQAKAINVRFTPRSFPQQEFQLQMEWNSVQSRWNISIHHTNRDNTLVSSAMAVPYRFYNYLPWVVFAFIDPSGEETQVTPRNLGDEVGFYVFPGEGGRPPEEW